MGDQRFQAPPPTADFCWEGRLACCIVLLCILYTFMSLRVKAVHGFHKHLSARGVSGSFVFLATLLCTIYTSMVIWNYSVWYRIRGLYEHSLAVPDESVADEILPLLRSLVPPNRKEVSLAMRMMLVTVLWLVKGSFILVYYAFAPELPRATRFLLYTTSAVLVLSYGAIWVVTAIDMDVSLKLEGYSPAAGAGIVLFTPPNTWGTWTVPKTVLQGKHVEVPNLLIAECIITGLNAGTDIMLLILVYVIFRHLSLARGKTHLRAMLMLLVLSLMSIVVALARFSIMVSAGMEEINFRLAFDTLTEFEAFLAACAACIPAMRVLARGGGNKMEFGFPENNWASRISRSIRGSTSGSSTSGHHQRDGSRPSLKSVSTFGTYDCMEKSLPPVPPLMQMATSPPTRPNSARTETDWKLECAGMPVVK